MHAMRKSARRARAWTWPKSLMALLALLLATAVAPVSYAQIAPDFAEQLSQAEADVRMIDRQASAARLSEKDRALLHGRLSTTRQSAAALMERLSGQLIEVDARIAELGAKVSGLPEAPELHRRRATLTAERLALDAADKRARLLVIEAQQLGDEMQRKEAEQFSARMARRTASPLTPGFWGAVIASFDADIGRIAKFLGDGQHQAQAQGRKSSIAFAFVGAVLAALLIGPGRRGALRLGQRYLISDAPGHRLRRSAYAIWVIVVGTLAPLTAMMILLGGAALSNLSPPNWASLLETLLASTGLAAFTIAVFGALLMRRQPSWRVAPISDVVAQRLRPLSWILAAITFFSGTIAAFNTAVGASAAAISASQVVQAGLSLLLIGGALLALGRIQAAEAEKEEGATASAGLSALVMALWIVILVASVALLIGYVEFSRFLLAMIGWSALMVSMAYLFMTAVDDAATGVFNRDSRLGRTLVRGVGIRGRTIDQFGVLLSGTVRIVLGLIALVLLLAPFGSSGIGSTIESIASAADGIEIGGVAISPGTIVRGVVVFAIGLALVRAFMSWLDRSYLPATELDGSGRNSVSLIARYIGIALAVIWALASLGIGVERIALLLSALSVGIGFGLQAITQNFISGLILLAERPIKIGDIIKVGSDEGDVKRISVRSTEIELGDHSTLIVPNSELITKSVLNKTLASPLGRVQIQFSVPIEADADAIEKILLEAYAAEPAILEQPAPSVFIDGIADGRTMFNSFAHVSGPRAAYGARSNVLKAIMRRLRTEGIELGTAPQKLELLPARKAERGDRA